MIVVCVPAPKRCMPGSMHPRNDTGKSASICLAGTRNAGNATAAESITNASSGVCRSMNVPPRSRTGSSSGTGKQTASSARGTGGIHTSVERRSRYLAAVKIPEITAQATLEAQVGMFTAMPALAAYSVTADNGSEFSYHYSSPIPSRSRPISPIPIQGSSAGATGTSTVGIRNASSKAQLPRPHTNQAQRHHHRNLQPAPHNLRLGNPSRSLPRTKVEANYPRCTQN